jgi:hypothetical protein
VIQITIVRSSNNKPSRFQIQISGPANLLPLHIFHLRVDINVISFFLISETSRLALRSTQPLLQWIPRIKRRRREAKGIPPSMQRARMSRGIPLFPCICLHQHIPVVCNYSCKNNTPISYTVAMYV